MIQAQLMRMTRQFFHQQSNHPPNSRLKSRYMSVALRGSPRGSLGTLRRTASLEFFLDMDKECAVEEVELDTPPPRPLVGVALSGLNHGIKVGVSSQSQVPSCMQTFFMHL